MNKKRDVTIRRKAVSPSKIKYKRDDRKDSDEYVGGQNCNQGIGCNHGCSYCYAFSQDKQFGKVKTREEWENVRMYHGAEKGTFIDLLDWQIKNDNIPRDMEIFWASMTDPCLPIYMKNGSTRAILERFTEQRYPYRLISKSHRIVELSDLFGKGVGRVGLSITTNKDNVKILKEWETKAPSIAARLKALEKLSKIPNINLYTSTEPFLPETDFRKMYDEIIKAGGTALKQIMIGKMNYVKGCNDFFDWNEVVEITEEYIQKYPQIHFHYKTQYWDFLTDRKLNPIQLGLR